MFHNDEKTIQFNIAAKKKNNVLFSADLETI